MFERFTDRARRVLSEAQEEARHLNHNFIGTEHVLLGLVSDLDSVAGRALAALGVTLEAARARVAETVGPGPEWPAGSPPFTPRAKKVLELSLREALRLEHNYIGPEHILLGLVREGDGVAATVLADICGSLDRVRTEVTKLISEEGPPPNVRAVRVSRRLGLRFSQGLAEPSGPECPGCRSDLADSLRWRRQAVLGQPPDLARNAVVWWCNSCGRTVSVSEDGEPA